MNSTAHKTYILLLEWEGFYAGGITPEVVIRSRSVLDSNTAAKAKGIVPGLSIPQVRNLSRECRIKEWNPEEYEAKTTRWLDLCVPFTGRIEPLDGHLAALDLSDHPQPTDIALRLIGQLERTDFGTLRYGAGPAKWIAQLAKKQADIILGDLIQATKDPAKFLAPQPVANLLAIEPEYRERLTFLGYRTIGEVANLPLEVLKGQFGKASLGIVNAAKGTSSDPVKPSYPPNILTEAFPFVERVEDTQVLEAGWERLTKTTIKRLDGQQASEVALLIEWECGQTTQISRRFTRPVFDHKTLRAAIRAQSETLQKKPPVEGDPVMGLSLKLSRLEPLSPRQQALIVSNSRPTPDQAVQSLKEVFGETVVILASKRELPRREQVLKEWRHATGWF